MALVPRDQYSMELLGRLEDHLSFKEAPDDLHASLWNYSEQLHTPLVWEEFNNKGRDVSSRNRQKRMGPKAYFHSLAATSCQSRILRLSHEAEGPLSWPSLTILAPASGSRSSMRILPSLKISRPLAF